MTVDGHDDLNSLKAIGGICRDVLQALGAAVRPGVTPKALDDMAARMLAERGARSAPILAYNFPGHTCISAGSAIAHGIPGDDPLTEGTLVNIDVSAEKDGYFGDCGQSFPVGEVSSELHMLLRATREAQYKAMMAVRAGEAVSLVGKHVERVARKYGLKVVNGLNGHGVGRWIHEEPTIPNRYHRGNRDRFEAGMVVTIEPFLTTKSEHYIEDKDGWTLHLAAGGHGAQFEHSFIVTDGDPIVLTA